MLIYHNKRNDLLQEQIEIFKKIVANSKERVKKEGDITSIRKKAWNIMKLKAFRKQGYVKKRFVLTNKDSNHYQLNCIFDYLQQDLQQTWIFFQNRFIKIKRL